MSEAKKVELDRVEMIVTPRFEQTGSIARGDASSRLLDVDTRLVLESSAEAAVVAEVVGAAERTCFLMDAIRNPRDVDARVELNGASLEVDRGPDV